jgi:hypothetical protein
MLADSGEISSQSPDPNQCQETDYVPPGGLCMQPGFFCGMWGFCQLQENKLVTVFATPPPPYRMWVQLQEVLQG